MDEKTNHVIIEDQTLRDGIQREAIIVPTDRKIEFIRDMVACGVKRFQVTAFVNPKRVPQMADAEELISRLQTENFSGISFFALVLNRKGLERALRCGCRNVEISISASHSHSTRNTGMGLEEAMRELSIMVSSAKANGLNIKVSVQCAFGCQYEGAVSENIVMDIIKLGLDEGAHEISLADTTGMAYPELVIERVSRVRELVISIPVFLHLHDAGGKGMDNVLAGIEAGVRHFDATIGGTGGCPFIPFAPPNIAMEALVNTLHNLGFTTGIDSSRLLIVREKAVDMIHS